MSPTKRTIERLESQGYRVDIAERRLPGGKTKDLFGFVDLVAVSRSVGIVAVQVTNKGNHANRKRKIVGECTGAAREWLAAGGWILLISWDPTKPAPREDWIRLGDIPEGRSDAD